MGKTLVLETFKKLGAFTIDADRVVAELLEEKPVLEKIKQLLGEDVFDENGRLLKDRVSDKIFRDESLRLTLEDIIHPLVFKKIDEILKDVKPDIAVVEATLIFERGYEDRFDKIITVYAEEASALERLQKVGVDRTDALRRLHCQMPIAEKIKRADYAIDNSESPDKTKEQVKSIYNELLNSLKVTQI